MSEQSQPSRTRDAEATKARLLRAATAEFAAHGIAGARVDRISTAARANKALIYAYFGNKDRLFDAVLDAHVARVLDEVPFTPEDLPGYAGHLFDFLLANPNQLRLAAWQRLERAGTGAGGDPAGMSDSMRRKIDAVAGEQGARRLPADFAPADLVVFTLALTCAWMPTSAMAPTLGDGDRIEGHRAAVVEAVRRLLR
ncbi:putative TetR family regulatory protein [Microtetraspora sp. NBRC 13810]|uniref:TetR family transcriptional regulator n=1 Tax=Microtetraspora sp. NBRC 13810 TaxID=3030990 RepID=UPI0024A05D37|nr:TetR family transcriptional regulator [Microtetraspora sp. NBRC 13810]GLW10759.1 putative TetR family regulatory protein [Microtetraspora sp. NBRC 13810]